MVCVCEHTDGLRVKAQHTPRLPSCHHPRLHLVAPPPLVLNRPLRTPASKIHLPCCKPDHCSACFYLLWNSEPLEPYCWIHHHHHSHSLNWHPPSLLTLTAFSPSASTRGSYGVSSICVLCLASEQGRGVAPLRGTNYFYFSCLALLTSCR